MLRPSEEPLCATHDLAMLDLDGVVYIGGRMVPGAAEAVDAVRRAGMKVGFVTNNASRTPESVAEQLVELGIPAAAADVVTSAQAAARVLAARFGTGADIALLGAEGLHRALVAEGLHPVAVSEDAVALVTGYAPEIPWRDIMMAAVRIRDGLFWVASNTDMSLPTPYGIAPGHGVLVETLRRFSGVEPVVAGKPARPLLEETVRRVGGDSPVMVGDRLDTDIAGGHRLGVPSLLVLTGVTGLTELVAAEPEERPAYIAEDLSGLTTPHPVPVIDRESARSGGWTATVDSSARLIVSGDGEVADWWRVAATAAWRYHDSTDGVVDTTHLSPPAATEAPGGGSLDA